MAAITHDLALRYLLELSPTSAGALLIDRDGELLASAAPELPAERLAATGAPSSRDEARRARRRTATQRRSRST